MDSSWASLLAVREAPGMKSFSVGFSESGFDETRDAKEVVAKGGLEYHEVRSDPSRFGKDLPRIIWHNDEPLRHANSVEIYNLCRYAKEHVKVLLTGEGAGGGTPDIICAKLGKSIDDCHLCSGQRFVSA